MRLAEHKQATRNGDANNHITVHHQLINPNIDWDSAQCFTETAVTNKSPLQTYVPSPGRSHNTNAEKAAGKQLQQQVVILPTFYRHD